MKMATNKKEHLLSDNDDDYNCSDCDKEFCSKYSLKRHLDTQHKKPSKSVVEPPEKKTKTEDINEEKKGEKDESDSDGEEPSDYIWRKILKRILRKKSEDPNTIMPKTEDDLIGQKRDIRDDLHDETLNIINDYNQLMSSPMYQKIQRSENRYKDQIGSDTDSDYEDEAYQHAFDVRKRVLDNFIIDNADVIDNYDQSTSEEETESEGNDSDDDDDE